jgi:hypothetical protein
MWVGRRRLIALTTALCVVGFVAVTPPASATTSQAPVVTAATISPSSVDTTAGPQQVTISLQVTAGPSGFQTASLGMVQPVGHYEWFYPTWTLSSGTPQSGTYTATIQLPHDAATGTWSLSEIVAYDNAGNWAYQSGYAIPTLQVTGGDGVAPGVQSASFTPSAVDTQSAPATVTVSLQVTAGASGFSHASLGMTTPNGNYDWFYPSWTLSAGTAQAGTYVATIQLPQGAASGVWKLAEIVTYDNADDWAYASGYSVPQLQVTNTYNSSAPQVQSASISPSSIDTGSGPGTVTISIQVTAGSSGFSQASLGMLTPNGNYNWYYPSWTLSAGTPQSGTYTATLQLPQYAAVGTWSLSEIVTYDNAGNWAYQSGYSIPTLQVTDLQTPSSPSISNIPASATYGGSFVPQVSTTGDGATSVATTTPSVCTLSSGTVDFVSHGTCVLQASVAAGTTTGAATGRDQSFAVAAAPLAITASSGTMTVGSTPPTIVPSYHGFVNGDTSASLSTQPTCSTTATPSSPAGTYPTNCSGATDPNYTFTYSPGEMVVSHGALVSISITGSVNVGVGFTTQLTATATFADGSTTDVTGQVTWSSSNSSVLGVSPSGLVSGNALGNANISATLDSVTGVQAMTAFHVNLPPLVSNSTLSLDAGTSVPVVLSAIDLDGGTISYRLTAGPSHGTLTGTMPNLVYTPAAGFTGNDSFTYAVSDGQGATVSATVTLAVGTNSPTSITQPVSAGQEVSLQTSVNASTSIIAAVTATASGSVTITNTPSAASPTGVDVLGQVHIDAPAASPSAPLTVNLSTNLAALPAGDTLSSLTAFRDGVAIGACTTTNGTATPDPCIAARSTAGSTLSLTVLSSHASDWTLAVPVDPTTTTLASIPGSTYGSPQTLTASVGVSGAATPTGLVQFTDTSTSPARVLGSASVNGSGIASLSDQVLAAGPHSIVASYLGDAGTATSQSAAATTTVAPKTLTITADDSSVVYGAASPSLTSTVSGLVAGDALSRQATCQTNAPAGASVGTYTITCSGAAAGPNYTIVYGAGTFSVTPAPVQVNVAARLIHGVGGVTFTSTTTTSGVSATNATCTTVSGGTTISSALPVGTYPIDAASCSGADLSSTNYKVGTYVGTLTVVPVGITNGTLLPHAVIGGAYKSALVAAGGKAPYAMKLIAGSLPAGVTLGSTGALTGTPSVTGAFTFKVQTTDASTPKNTGTDQVTLVVDPMTISTSSLADGVVEKAYSTTLTTRGGKTALTWSVASGALPAGLKLSTAGVLSGTPTTVGQSTFTISVHDSSTPQQVATKTFSLAIDPMAITTTSVPDGLVGKPYPSTTLKESGGKVTYTWTIASGALPSGLKLSTSGIISGTPTAPGTSTFVVKLTDGSTPKNVATQQLTLTVSPMTVATTSLPAGAVGKLYSGALKANGGVGTLTWTVATGPLPPGLSLARSGAISGTPTSKGAYVVTFRVTDAANPKNTATQQLTITVS